ncbi:MAG: hypothetical protein ACTSSP_00400 [Candidatus Asgardarchaeia archaeon]
MEVPDRYLSEEDDILHIRHCKDDGCLRCSFMIEDYGDCSN